MIVHRCIRWLLFALLVFCMIGIWGNEIWAVTDQTQQETQTEVEDPAAGYTDDKDDDQTPPPVYPLSLKLFPPIGVPSHLPGTKSILDINLLFGRSNAVYGLNVGSSNQITGDLRGIQLGGLFNLLDGMGYGLQIAGLFNYTRGSLRGVQVGLANIVLKDMSGLQLGLANITLGSVYGVQLGATNIADSVYGMQIGVVNKAGTVHGVQVGVVNVADDIKGVPIGLFNIIRAGNIRFRVWSAWRNQANIGIKFVVHKFATLVQLGFDYRSEHVRGTVGFGLGTRIPIKKFYFEASTTYLSIFDFSTRESINPPQYLSNRVSWGWTFHKTISVFWGGGIQILLHNPLPYSLTPVSPDIFVGIEF